jgi:anaerobic selenocysteine-containing dehydrogenase
VTDDATHLRICPLCEATCGLRLEMADDRVARVTGDAEDVFSRGYLCPKGVAIGDLHADTDRLTAPSGGTARVASRTGEVDVEVELTDALRRGVVSLPHGWGHGRDGSRLEVAARRPGVSSNILTDPDETDPLSGNAVLNGIPVTVTPVPAPAVAQHR